MQQRTINAEEKLLVNYGCFFPPEGYVKHTAQGQVQSYNKIKKEEVWFIANDDDDDNEIPLEFTRYTCSTHVFSRQSRHVKNFAEIDYIELVIKNQE